MIDVTEPEGSAVISFATEPSAYRHWELSVDGPVATLTMRVTPDAGLRDDYELKLNSYDLGVDIELHDAVQRLRFEHPEVRAVVVTGGLDKVFCAGANIQMLAGSTHAHKVGFCKFTNETRNSIEDATAHSGQVWIAAVNGTAAGGGYELALACDEIVLVDDRSSAVSLPEVPLLAVLPGTGGLTRVVDKRHVRRDLADVFATRAEGVKGQQALDWGLVDAIAPRSRFDEVVRERAPARAAASHRPTDADGSRSRRSTPRSRRRPALRRTSTVDDRPRRSAPPTSPCTARPAHPSPTRTTLDAERAGSSPPPASSTTPCCACASTSPRSARGCCTPPATPAPCSPPRTCCAAHADHWLVNEVRAAVDPRAQAPRPLGPHARRARRARAAASPACSPSWCSPPTARSCSTAPTRTATRRRRRCASPTPTTAGSRCPTASAGWRPASGAATTRSTRARGAIGKDLLAADAADVELVTFTPDDIDWDDDVRLMLEERNSFSPDALTAMEANYRFVGPETMETKIFARLTAWQNWVFQRPNAVGPDGALRRYGTGSRPTFDRTRV